MSSQDIIKQNRNNNVWVDDAGSRDVISCMMTSQPYTVRTSSPATRPVIELELRNKDQCVSYDLGKLAMCGMQEFDPAMTSNVRSFTSNREKWTICFVLLLE